MNIYRERMQNVVRALRESPDPSKFTMRVTFNDCGTPACALGHYANRVDLQSVYTKKYGIVLRLNQGLVESCMIHANENISVEDHFGVTVEETFELFGTRGCNNAQTPEEAIAYLEAFIERKWPREGMTEGERAKIEEIVHEGEFEFDHV